MTSRPLLLIPGPVRTSDRVREAMAREMITHRGPEFEGVYRECQDLLRPLFGTTNDLVFLGGTGTAGMETAVSNTVTPEDTVVCVENGYFGERFADIATGFAGTVRRVTTPYGTPIEPAAIQEAMTDDVALVTAVHADTSVGLVNNIPEIARIAREHDALVAVDCVTGVGCEDVRVDEWDIDIAVTATQKGLGCPPGLSALVVSDRAQARLDPDVPSYYLNLERHLDRAGTHQTPTTSSVPLFWALQAGLQELTEEGHQAVIDRRARYAAALREAGTALGLDVFPQPGPAETYTNGVVVLTTPEGIDPAVVIEGMRRNGVLIKRGLGPAESETIRIGTMGAITADDVLTGIRALETTLADLGHSVNGEGEAAAKPVLT